MKKIMCMLLTVAMVVSVYSCGFAESEEWKNNTGTVDLNAMTVTGEGIAVEGNTVLITAGGDFDVTGTLADGMIKINTEDRVKLRLSGASITNSTGPAIYFENTDKGFITITEGTENYLTDGSEYAIEDADATLFSNDDLEIKGGGSLTVTANYMHGIASDDDMNIENGIITVSSYEHGIKVNNTLTITGGVIDIKAKTGKGIKAEEELVIDGGDITVVTEENEGIESKGTLDINGGNISITAGEDGINAGSSSTADNAVVPENGERPQMPEGMTPPEEMEMPDMRTGGGRGAMGGRGDRTPPELPEGMTMPENMTPPDGMQRPDGMNAGGRPQGNMGGFGRIDEETAAAHAVTITGGNVYINYTNPESDGIDANGNLTISGGRVVIEGATNGMECPLDSDGTMSITGGEVLILTNGRSMMIPKESVNVVSADLDNAQSAGSSVSICDTDGNEMTSHTSVDEYSSIVFYSDALKAEGEYGIYVNSELAKTVTASEQLTVGREMGMQGGNRGGNRNRTQGSISVDVDGKEVSFETEPVVKNNTTLVGFRAILELLGAEVRWNQETQTVTATKDGINITLTINSDKATVNGVEKTLLTAPEIIGGSTMIPVRFISEEMGMDVEWNQESKKVSVKSR